MLTKTRHNKKRNTAFIYEALIRELTKCVVSKDEDRKNIVVSIVKEHYAKGTSLRKELDLYKSLYETKDLESHMCEKLIYEVKRSHSQIDTDRVFQEQTALINKINKMLSKDVFSNFIPNYKSLATISQILNPDVSPKRRVILENTLAQSLCSADPKENQNLAPVDNLIYKTFVKKFNEQYGGKLLENQERLLSKYIASFYDDGVEMNIFLNEELGRIKCKLRDALADEGFKTDSILRKKAERVMSIVEGYEAKQVDTEAIQQILKIQTLVEELPS